MEEEQIFTTDVELPDGTVITLQHPERTSDEDLLNFARQELEANRIPEAEETEEEVEAREQRARIYHSCILDKSQDVDMSLDLVARAVNESCSEISKNPSWLERLWYD